MNYHHKKNQGFALLIGILVTTILISITFLMFNISLKQVALTTAGKNSQLAFYASDTGAECVLYADTNIDQAFVAVTSAMDASGNSTLSLTSPGTKTLNCNGQPIIYTPTIGSVTINLESGPVTYSALVTTVTVNAKSFPTIPTCASVTIAKYKVPQIVSGKSVDILKTKIQSKGYNACIKANDPFKVERGLEISY